MNHDIYNVKKPHTFPPGKIYCKNIEKDKYQHNQLGKAF